VVDEVPKDLIKQVVNEEIVSGGYPFPAALIYSLIEVESSWMPGIVNPKSGATGLMQVMPVVLSDYNKVHPVKFTLDFLKGKTLDSIRAQIKVGLWILGAFWRGAYGYVQPKTLTVPVDELVRIGDMFYVAGPGATRKRLSQLSTPTYSAVVSRFPAWEALPHVQKVWDKTAMQNPVWDLNAIDDWVKKVNQPLIAGFDGHLGGFILGAIALIFGWYLIGKKKSVKDADG